jgi:hypothetical protein
MFGEELETYMLTTTGPCSESTSGDVVSPQFGVTAMLFSFAT